jgi:hypothetical protein
MLKPRTTVASAKSGELSPISPALKEIQLAYKRRSDSIWKLKPTTLRLVSKTLTPLLLMILVQTLDANKSICMPGTNQSLRRHQPVSAQNADARVGRFLGFTRASQTLRQERKKAVRANLYPLGQTGVNESLYRSDDGLVLQEPLRR